MQRLHHAVDVQPSCGRVRTLLIAQTLLYREGLAQILSAEPRIDVVGTAGDIDGGMRAVSRLTPDAVLLDVWMASESWAVKALVQAGVAIPVVVFGVSDDEDTIIRCAEAGVAGYVPCEAGVEDLVLVLTGAIRDELVCTPRLAGTLLRRIGAIANERRGDEPPVRLTARETQVVSLVEEGLSNKEIAARLHISLPTVKNHIHNLLEKLGATRRSEAAARARALRVPTRDRFS